MTWRSWGTTGWALASRARAPPRRWVRGYERSPSGTVGNWTRAPHSRLLVVLCRQGPSLPGADDLALFTRTGSDLAALTIGLKKTEGIRRDGPFRSVEELELAALFGVDLSTRQGCTPPSETSRCWSS